MITLTKFLFACILILSLAAVQSKSKIAENSDQQQVGPLLKNLFLTQKDVLISIQIISSKKQILSSRNVSIILEEDYFEMYKKKLDVKLPLKINEEILKNLNNLKIKVSLFTVKDQIPIFLCSQQIGMVHQFTEIRRQGLQLFFDADISQMDQNEIQYIIEHLDIYLFNPQIQVQQSFQESSYKTYNSSHYFVKPLVQKVNQVDVKQYKPISDLKNGEDHQVSINLKLKSDFTLVITNIIMDIMNSNFLNQSLAQIYEPQELEQLKGSSYFKQFEKLVLLLAKRLWIDASTLGVFFLYFKLLVYGLFVPISPFIVFIYTVKQFRNIKNYRGISITPYIGCIILSRFKGNDSSIIQLLYYSWMVSKVMRLGFTGTFPFICLNKQPWYQKYYHLQKKVIKKTILCILPLFLIYLFFRILFLDYSYTAQQIVSRSIQFVLIYQASLLIIPQIIMNYELKSTQGVSWTLTFWSMCYYMSDMFRSLASDSYLNVLYYMKQEILMLVFYYQRSIYKGNKNQLLQDAQDQYNDQGNQQDQALNLKQSNNEIGSLKTQQNACSKESMRNLTNLNQEKQAKTTNQEQRWRQNHQKNE